MDTSLVDFISRLYAKFLLFLQGEGQLDVTLFGLLVCVCGVVPFLVFIIFKIVTTPPAGNTVVVPPPSNGPAVPWTAFVVLIMILGIGFVVLYMFSSS